MSDSKSVGGWRSWHDENEPLRLGVSSCLLGEEVRFDGGHKRNRFVSDVLGAWVEWVPVCPEVEVGMGIPRPTIHLEGKKEAPRLLAPSTGEDFTEPMNSYADRKLGELDILGLDGYVLKSKSPSCGMERISLYKNGMKGERNGVGLFAAKLMERMPQLPIEEEGRLNDPLLRENFVERILCRSRWRQALRLGLTRKRLVHFHTAHKLLLRAHDETGYRNLGTLVGSAGTISDEELFAQYELVFQSCLRTKTSVKKHTNVLQHAMGYLKDVLGSAEKHELLSAIEDYRLGLLPLIVPLTLLRFNVNRHDIDYLQGQLYFDPHPKELMLRNHA
ncbi:MAG: hypothetical protein ACI8X5_002512 [Planctomycetota bacterium]|jgi:uncharacterized protein YbgA (DUF1722 family)/uncharacterized protein YbbK (DUF523 family)